MPELRRLLIGDDPQGWEAAGFTVVDGLTTIGTIEIRFVEGRGTGVVGMTLTDLPAGTDSIDGLPAEGTVADPANPIDHPNRVSRLDHVVVMTPDIDRTIGAMEAVGLVAKRTRDIPNAEPPRRQVFLWAGETILEVVGPTDKSGDGPASVWGLALTTEDMMAAAETLGERLTNPKPAVQVGREIATVKTKDLGISVALAIMTPHVDPATVSSPDA